WWMYTRAVLPVASAVGGRAWIDVGRFLGPNVSAHYARHPVPEITAAWRDAGLIDVHADTMSLGGGLVMWGRKRDGLGCAPAGLLQRARWRLARLVVAAASPLHGVAPRVRRHRSVARGPRRRRPSRRDPRRLLRRRRRRLPRARRTQRSPVAHTDQRW